MPFPGPSFVQFEQFERLVPIVEGDKRAHRPIMYYSAKGKIGSRNPSSPSLSQRLYRRFKLAHPKEQEAFEPT